MKVFIFSFTMCLFWCNTCDAQLDTFIVKRFRQIIRLIETDNAKSLAKLVNYPLKRINPLPDIKNSNDFIAYYPVLFDESFKSLLKKYDDNDIFERNGEYGLVGDDFTGEIWIDEGGKILGIAYSSKKEQEVRQILTEKIKKEMYPTVSTFDDNVIVARSAKLLIRVDRTEKGLRYVCWSKGQAMKDPPDIILYNGIESKQGTMGGWTWTFKNGDWTYVVDDVEICDEPNNCGLFLELLFKDELKNTIKLTEIK